MSSLDRTSASRFKQERPRDSERMIGVWVPEAMHAAFAALARSQGMRMGQVLRTFISHTVGQAASRPLKRTPGPHISLRLSQEAREELTQRAQVAGIRPTSYAAAVLEKALTGQDRPQGEELTRLRACYAAFRAIRTASLSDTVRALAEEQMQAIAEQIRGQAGNVEPVPAPAPALGAAAARPSRGGA